MKTGIDAKEISAILKGEQDITVTEMDKIVEASGKNTEYFLQEPFGFLEEINFCSAKSIKGQEKVVNTLVKLLENMNEVISAKG